MSGLLVVSLGESACWSVIELLLAQALGEWDKRVRFGCCFGCHSALETARRWSQKLPGACLWCRCYTQRRKERAFGSIFGVSRLGLHVGMESR